MSFSEFLNNNLCIQKQYQIEMLQRNSELQLLKTINRSLTSCEMDFKDFYLLTKHEIENIINNNLKTNVVLTNIKWSGCYTSHSIYINRPRYMGKFYW